jgi:hypothetical protein
MYDSFVSEEIEIFLQGMNFDGCIAEMFPL